jgi:hypothetical protein
VLRDGALAGTWKAKAGSKGTLEISVDRLAPLDRDELERECARLAKLRGAEDFDLSLS